MITVEMLMVFDFNVHIALQVDMIQVIASKERSPGDSLPETKIGQSIIFPPLSVFLRVF